MIAKFLQLKEERVRKRTLLASRAGVDRYGREAIPKHACVGSR